MLEDDKKAYDLEKKAFAILTQALNKEIYHQFSYCKDTKTFVDTLCVNATRLGSTWFRHG
ncbi:hypothetical protein Hanom_Chr16g01468441 [Helianthus anomalus]